MTGRERGFLLLGSHLGNPRRRVLTTAQMRTLASRMQQMERPYDNRELEEKDLLALGYGHEMSGRILSLLDGEAELDHYLNRGGKKDCFPITRAGDRYPLLLRKRLGLDSPGVLWAKGDLSLLEEPTITLVGSRDLLPMNRCFAEEAGRQAALQGYVLVSGNARGADRAAQDACLEAGGKVISIVADELWKQPLRENVLYLSEDGWDEAFSSQRALSRNRCVHALGLKTLVAQSSLGTGGTWDGTVKNLRFGWSRVFCLDDGSDAMEKFSQMGATLIGIKDLASFYDLPEPEQSFFEIN